MDKRTYLAFVLIGLIALFMSSKTYKQWVGQPTQPVEQTTAQIQDDQGSPDNASGDGWTDEDRSDPEEAFDSSDLVEDAPFTESLLRVETPHYIMTFSNRGGGPVRGELKGLKSYYGETVLLFDNGGNNTSLLLNYDGQRIDTGTLPFESDRDYDLILGENEQASLAYRYTMPDGAVVEKTFRFDAALFVVEMDLSVRDLSSPLRGGNYYLGWDSPMRITEPDTLQDAYYTEALALMGNDVDNFGIGRRKDIQEESWEGSIGWAGARTKYFALIIEPDRRAEKVSFVGQQQHYPGGRGSWKHYSFELGLALESQRGIDDSFRLYMGPLSRSTLVGMSESVSKAVMTKTSLGPMSFMWGMIKPFAIGILWLLKFLHKFISNYGIILLLLAVVIKLITWPLTMKSYRSMKEMANIKPLLEELQKKYANDKQKLQVETMALYKEHGVNPFGSCLPTLLQMPVLFALFFVFRGTFELRGASFFGWINDLSVPDVVFSLPFSLPFYGADVAVLPLVYTVISIFTFRMTMADQQNKMMMYAMPLMMLMIFNRLPSGLTLYYIAFNLLQLVQQHYTKGMTVAGPSQASAANTDAADSIRMKRKRRN